MGKFTDSELSGVRIANTETRWENYSGAQVEDFITRKLEQATIARMEYSGQILTVTNEDGSKKTVEISVIEPTYSFGIMVYGLRLDGDTSKVYTEGSSLLMQYNSDRKVEVGIAMYAIQTTNTITDRIGPFNVKIAYGTQQGTYKVNNINYEDCIIDSSTGNITGFKSDDISWIDITTLFNKTQTAQLITATVIDDKGTAKDTMDGLPITTQVISLAYNGNAIVSNNFVGFALTGGNTSNYHLEGFNNGEAITKTGDGILNYTNLQSGLNQLVIQAVHNTDPTIYTDYVFADIIYTEGCTDTVIAINGVSNGISNNGVATLYKLSVYSPNLDSVEISTYLESEMPTSLATNPPTEIMKYEIINTSSYKEDGTYETSYEKYIEINSSNSERYLVVKKDNSYYSFYNVYRSSSGQVSAYQGDYKTMTIEAVNSDFVYYQDVTPNFNYDQIGGYLNNVFVTSEYATASQPATVVDTLESSDGWYEEGGRTIFKISAQEKPILKSELNLNLTNSFTMELGLKTYNISNENKPILTLGNLQVRPTQICWWDASSMKEEDLEDPESATFTTFTKRNAQFQENVETHIMICVQKGFAISKDDIYYPNFLQGTYQTQFDSLAPSTTFNLVRIFINGVIDREIELEDNELANLINSTLQINPTTSDVDFYLFRVYNNSFLGFKEVQKNYISFLKNKTDKQAFFDHNDILGDNGEISFERTLGKQNSLVYIYPKGARFPNRFWEPDSEDGTLDNSLDKDFPVTLFINYADSNINQRFGGRLTHGQVKGQGSSAMRYLIWNVTYALNKFKDANKNKIKSLFIPYSQLNTDTNRFVEGAQPSLKGAYVMPPYDGQVDGSETEVTKLVGKVNFASSMQSHKIGACKLFDDAYKTAVTPQLPSGGRKAVHEEPYLYFYWESDLEDVSNVELADILANNESIKFMGFQTWGAGKGDDAESGYDEDLTPEYLMLEGGENTDPAVNFRCPWQALQRATGTIGTADYKLSNAPTISYADSLAAPWDKLLIDDESIVYLKRGAWDIDFGCEEVEEEGKLTYFKFADSVHESLKKFRAFYDFVYEHDHNYIVSNDTTPNNWDTTRKYLVTGTSFSINGTAVTGHTTGDLYRYDDVTEKWVRAGVSYDSTSGWAKSNIYTITGVPQAAGPTAALTELKEICKARLGEFVEINDIAFHQAFVKFVSGTDNRAKNTYFQIIGKLREENADGDFVENGKGDYLIRLIGDDLDTILVTDNNGLQSKPYNLLEDSYEPAHSKHWGDANNVFFKMFDQNYEEEIKAMLGKILEMAKLTSTNVNMDTHYFYKAFFSVQEGFPAIAYNHAAKIYYENAQAILNSKVSQQYQNNAIEPLEQSHGSCLACERQFLTKRMGFLSGYALTQLGDLFDTAASAGSGGDLKLRMEFEPYQDFYPAYKWESNYYLGEFQESEYDIIKHLVKQGSKYTVEVAPASTAINQGLYQPTLYKTLNIVGLKRPSLDPDYSRVIEFKIDNDDLYTYKSFFGEDYPELSLSSVTANFPVLEKLTLNNMDLQEELDFSTYYKLKDLDLTGTNVKNVIFPQTGRLANLVLPDTITTFRLYNNPGLKSVDFAGTDNLKTIYIDCAKCGEFDVNAFCEILINCNSLESVTFRNADLWITEDALQKLISIDNFNIEGSIHIVTVAGGETLKSISYATKETLVKEFGNIDSDTAKVKVYYFTENITAFTVNSEISLYMPSGYTTYTHPNTVFGIAVAAGNDIEIVDGNPAKLNITYSMTTIKGVASIDSEGRITQKSESDSTATVTIKMKVKNRTNPLEQKVTVKFKWVAPEVGNFAYADGTFSNAYDTTKTLVGIVYAKEAESDTEGDVFILGKEYSSDTPFYLGYETGEGDVNSSNTTSKEMGYVMNYASSTLGLADGYASPEGVSDGTSHDVNVSITVNDYTDTINTTFTGKEDTQLYVDNVNKVLLPILINKKIGTKYITTDQSGSSDSYSINSLDNLISLGKTIKAPNVASDLTSCLLFPYFYSMHLYQPSVKDGETLDTQYTQGNWYAPSVSELNRVLFYRGYSAMGSSFLSINSVRAAINNKLTTVSSKGVLGIPIFSLALAKMTSNFPTEWTVFNGNSENSTEGGINNIASTMDSSSTDNYSYVSYSGWINSEYTTTTAWRVGEYMSGYTNPEGYNASRLITHQGIPFVTYHYKKVE